MSANFDNIKQQVNEMVESCIQFHLCVECDDTDALVKGRYDLTKYFDTIELDELAVLENTLVGMTKELEFYISKRNKGGLVGDEN